MARILIVDDEEMDRVFLDSLLGPAGHTLLYAPDGKAALEAYREREVDVVLTDLKMPELNGLQFIQVLRKEDPRACVVVLSGADEASLYRARELGAVDALEKPVDPKELLEALEAAERRREKRSDPWT